MDSLTFIRAHLEPLAGKRILDVGCGRGALAKMLAADGAVVTGVDPGTDAISYARTSATGVTFEIASAQTLPFADATFDAILFVNSLHHVPQDAMRPALHEARRVGVPDARLIVIEPLLTGGFNDVLKVIDDETTIRTQAQDALRDIAEHEGFDLVESLTYTRAESHRDIEAFIARTTAVEPERKQAAVARRAALEGAFFRHARHDDAGRLWFDQELKADAFALR